MAHLRLRHLLIETCLGVEERLAILVPLLPDLVLAVGDCELHRDALRVVQCQGIIGHVVREQGLLVALQVSGW